MASEPSAYDEDPRRSLAVRQSRAAMRTMALGTAAAYAVATVVTDPVFVADTPDMAWSSVARVLGHDCTYLEPGHLLWRPTGFALLQVLGTAKEGMVVDAVFRTSQVQLGWVAWVAGLIAAVCTAVWLQRRVGAIAASAFGVAVIIASKAFLNYSQVGVSYVPALACLMAALLILSRDDGSPILDMFAGVLLGTSVLLWGTFVLALPVALAEPVLLGRDARQGFRRSAFATAGGAVCAVLAAAWVWQSKGFASFAELSSWAATADHGISTSGIPRAVLGFARSYLETGDYGKLVKRFLLGDPADPVSMPQLLGLPFFGILGFYLGLLIALVAAWRHPRRRGVLACFAVNAVPVVFFAIAWQGGDLERYLPLVPGVALLAAAGYAAAARWQRGALAGWLLLIIGANAAALGRPAVAAQRDRVRTTLAPVEGADRRLVVFSHWQDDRVQFDRNYPPREAPLRLQFYHLFTPGNPSVDDWQPRAADRILSAFDAGTEVFVSQRLLTPAARREWAWVEGDDPRVSWGDLHAWFTGLTYTDTVGIPGDGFLRLPPTAANRAVLTARKSTAPPAGPDESCPLPVLVPPRSASR